MKVRNGFGYISIADNFTTNDLLGAVFSSVSYDRLIRRIEWSIHPLPGQAIPMSTTGIYVASVLIFAGSDSKFNQNWNPLTLDWGPGGGPEVLYAQSFGAGFLGPWLPQFADVNFNMANGRDYTVAVSGYWTIDPVAGLMQSTPGSGRTLNVLGENVAPEKVHWR